MTITSHGGAMKYFLATLAIASMTGLLTPVRGQINHTIVSLALLLVVLFTATLWGSRPAVLASFLGVLCFNFFFLPPVHTLHIADPDNWVALAAFLITALTAGQLSARAKWRAEEAEAGRREIERLYRELREAFERASHAEALRQSERLKSALLDAVTHDLRTPLTSIKASVTTLLGDVRDADGRLIMDPEGQQELLEVIDEEADRLNHYVESMVELARIEAGEMRLRRSPERAEEIVAAALARARHLTRAHAMEVNVEPDLPLVRVDAAAVAEVIYSLVDNASKYAPAGTRIRADCRTAGEVLEFSVEDEGRGVTEEMRERVFDKFFRAGGDESGDRHRPAGVGMGLSIARGIVEAHGGRIWIEGGRSARGARVVFVIPLAGEETGVPSSAVQLMPAAGLTADSDANRFTADQ